MESVYLETTFISYLVAPLSRDLLVAAHQQITQDWWSRRRPTFDCFISQVVIDEVSGGNRHESEKRLAITADLTALEFTGDAGTILKDILASGVLPANATLDAAHVAVATLHRMDYLLTWNCKHLANAKIVRRMEIVCARLGYRVPLICTPESLMGD